MRQHIFNSISADKSANCLYSIATTFAKASLWDKSWMKLSLNSFRALTQIVWTKVQRVVGRYSFPRTEVRGYIPNNLSYPRTRVSKNQNVKWIPSGVYPALCGKGMTTWVVFLALLVYLTSTVFAQTSDFLWAKRAGGTDNDWGYGIVVDGSGNSYVTGYFQSSSITFGTTTLTNVGNVDIFTVKYDASGNVVWAKSAGGTSGDYGNGIAVDGSGNSYVTGYFQSSNITFGTTTLTNASIGTNDIFTVKYDASGNVVWAKSAGGTSGDAGKGIVVDASGNSYVTGHFLSSSITFGTTTLTNVGSVDIFTVKYDASGNVVWAKSAGGIEGAGGYSIAVDGSGNSYVNGYFFSSITFGTTTLTNAGSADIFTVKYDASGNVVWAKSAGGTSADYGNGIAVDGSGNSYVTGYFQSSSIIFGTTTLTNASIGTNDIFTVKYDASGNVVWAKSAGGIAHDFGNAISVDVAGNSYLTGYFQSSSITFSTTTLTNASIGSNDIFVTKVGNSSFTITASAGTNGIISPGTSTVNYGTSKQFTISSNTGYHIDSVLIDNVKVDSTSSYTFYNVIANHTIRAVFAVNTSLIVKSVSPTQNSLSISKATNISATFNVAMNTGTLNASNIFVSGMQSGKHTGTITLNGDTAFTFNPTTDFKAGEIVNVTLKKNIKSASGDSLTNGYHWSFTVATTPSAGTFEGNLAYETGTSPASVYMGDIDGDWDNDVVIANYSSNTVSVLKNNGNGTFQSKIDYQTGSAPYSVFVSDVDNDGDGDIAVANISSSSVSVLRNNGNGTFQPKLDYAVGSSPYSVCISDLNGDGFGDIVTNNVSVVMNNGDGTFGARADYTPGINCRSVFASDIDNDNDFDIVVSHYNSNFVSVFRNNGNGTLQTREDYPSGVGSFSVTAGDLNGDGYNDLVVANYGSGDISILLNTGNGTFYPKIDYAVGSNPYAIVISDIDGDGDGDLAFVKNGFNVAFSIMKNSGNGMFQTPEDYANGGSSPVALFAGDLDGDGDADITVANQGTNTVFVLKNMSGTGSISGMKWNDLNSNGIKDGNEYGIPNWKIYNYGTVTDSQSTDAYGNYSFSNLLPGNYTIIEEMKEGWTQTFPPQNFYYVPLNTGQNVLNVNFGNHLVVNGSISGMKWNDLNGNGQKDVGDVGIADWKIMLYGTSIDSEFTDDDGNYTFNDVPAGNYTVMEDQQNGWTQTFPPQNFYSFYLNEGQNETDMNFGNHLPVDTLLFTFGGIFNGHSYFISRNEKTWHQAKQDCELNGGHLVTISDAGEDNFVLSLISSGSYWIGLTDEAQEGIFRWITNEPLAYMNWCPGEPSNSNNEDYGEINGCSFGKWNDQNITSVRKYILEMDDLQPPEVGTISGMKWNDVNANGLKEENEPVLSDWKIYLSGTEVETTSTEDDGMYFFTDLSAGQYTVSEEQQSGWVQTYPTVPGVHTVTLEAGEIVDEINFGNRVVSYGIIANAQGNGSITPSGEITVEYGDSIVFTVTPNSSCYKISKITLDGDSVFNSSPYTLRNISATHTVTAYFVQKTFSITESHGENGSISPLGVTPVNCGDSVVYTISPNTCYRTVSVTINGETNIGVVNSYTFHNVQAHQSITATFAMLQYAIEASAGENGSITPSGSVTVNCNGSQTYSISANVNYKIDSVFVNDVYVGKDSLYSFSNVTASHSIRATFKAINNFPVATSLSDSIEKNRSKTITLIGEDPEGGSVTFFLDDQPLNGTIRSFNSTTGEVLYRPDYAFVGLDSFSFYCRDSLNAISNTAWCIVTVYQKIDSTSFRSFSQSDLKTAALKKPKKGVRPLPTTGNVLDSLFINGLFKKLKDKTNPNFPGGMVLGVAQSSKDSAKKYGWIRLIGKSKDVQKSLTQSGSPRGFDVFSNNKLFTKELKNHKTDKYSNQLAGELLALKVNIAASEQKITNEGFGNLVYDNPQQNPDTFVTQRLKIQGKTLAQISAEIDTMLTYYKRYYTGTTPTEEYSKITTVILSVNEAFRSAIDTIGWSPLQLTSDVRIDGIEFLKRGSGKERLFAESEFASSVPEEVMLLRNYPNPFNPTTAISFSLLAVGEVSLQVFDVLGREVATLLNNETLEEGEHEIQFDASGLTSGVYFYRLSARRVESSTTREGQSILLVRKMVLMK